ncbi:MAG: TonB family protein [Candidatus Omnitrophica bacterium]|nr:TonB family protein [Candidatus Omnitrophota bacterium]
MRKIFLAVFIIMSSIVLPLNNYASDEPGEEIRLYMGEVKIIPVRNPMRVAIGNPGITDVANITKENLTLNPKATGNTTLVVWDNFGEQSYNVKVFSEDTSAIKTRIDNVLKKLNLPDVITKAEDEEGKVFLSGKVKTLQDKERIVTSLGPLKDKTVDLISVKEEEAVIEIDVQILEINKGASDTLGLTWPGSINFTEVGSAGITAGGTTWGKVFHVANITRGVANPFTLKLDALIQEGKARVLSRPRLSCQSGKEAKLSVGGEVPVLSSTVTGGGVPGTTATPGNVEYKEYGIILKIKPVVYEKDRIHVNLNVEVSEVGDEVSTDYALAYKITKRSASTELFLDNNQTMAIGGLIKQKTQEDLRRVPWLSDVPVLGMFFRQKKNTQGGGYDNLTDTELFITLTPRIVSSVQDLEQTTKKEAGAKPALDETLLDPVTKYSSLVQKRILDNLKYPPSAQGSGFQGTVILDLKLSYKGDLLAVKIKESSGYKMLDSNAINTAKKVSPYPPFPPAIGDRELQIEVPIQYQLD